MELISQERPKKRKFSLTFYLIVIVAVLITLFDIYSIKKAEKELGFSTKINLKEFVSK